MTIRKSGRYANSGVASVLKVERPFYEQQQFNNELNYCEPEMDRKAYCSQWIYNVKPKSIILTIFPVFQWLSQYNIKNDLVGDIISGCTVAIMHIPQGKLCSVILVCIACQNEREKKKIIKMKYPENKYYII